MTKTSKNYEDYSVTYGNHASLVFFDVITILYFLKFKNNRQTTLDIKLNIW